MYAKNWRWLIGLMALLAGAVPGFGQGTNAAGLAPGFVRWELQVDGDKREALVYVPQAAKEKPAPVVFVFHGHGGRAQNVVKSFAMNRHWPEAISVYMQGLNTPGRLTDPEGKVPGWQKYVGDQHDRDLKFFDAVWARLQQDYKVDKKRVFSTGHSNGGAFTYLLWAERGQVFAAMAPSAGMAAESLPKLKPKPVMHIAGEKDTLVKFEWQQKIIEAVRRLNGCEAMGKPWDKYCTLYPSKSATPVVAFIHPGGHQVPLGGPALIVKFFQEVTRPDYDEAIREASGGKAR
jgi:polyhydroxybutyrate depolymerase